MLSLSSSCFPAFAPSPVEAIRHLVQQGITTFELQPAAHPLPLPAIQALRQEHPIHITSLHNICSSDPASLAPDDRYGNGLSSPNEEIRQIAVHHLAQTAETALALGARAIVVHGGEHTEARAHPLARHIRAAMRSPSLDLNILRSIAIGFYRWRLETATPYLEALIRSLREICPRYPALHFGLENRYHLYGIPAWEELEIVLTEVNAPNLGFWHDVGHAQVQENLGIVPAQAWLTRYGSHLIGVHIHGMRPPFSDHFPPTPRNIPHFDILLPYLKDPIIITAEIAAQNEQGAILEGWRWLNSFLNRHTNQGAPQA